MAIRITEKLLKQQADVTTTDRSEPARNYGIPLHNRFAPLQNENQENDPSSKNNKRYENNLHSKLSFPKLSEKEHPTRPRTLIVGNTVLNGFKNFCNKSYDCYQ
ncbi:hypothetical protein AMECASPLE_010789 [Ameca splendens]|uniref:Uncharacterized protein n=1 Tax=Ameca splendens TaxID=208324 RepID=A0ABV0ZKB1_9TELE